MCLLIYASPGSTPTKKALRTAGKNNPDGFGFAFAINNQIVRHRSMDLEDTIKFFHEMRAEYPMAHAIFHLRITTHGGTNLDNCHPFMVDDGIVLGHNGMLPIKEQDGKSDTRQFAEEWLPQLGVAELLDNPENFAELEKFATGSKLAILSVNPVLAKPVYIVNEGDGHWDKGVWYSNNSYKYEYVSYSYGSWRSSTTTHSTSELEEILDNDDCWQDEDGMWWWWDAKNMEWVLEQELFSADDVEEWVCRNCEAQFTFDLSTEQPDYCYDCGACWYCSKSFGSCYCGSVNNNQLQ